MAQKGIEDANDILAPTDNKRDLKARARLVYGNRCEASLASFAAPLPPNLGRPDAALSPLSLCYRRHARLTRWPCGARRVPATPPPTLARPPYYSPIIGRGTILTPEDRPSSRGKSDGAA